MERIRSRKHVLLPFFIGLILFIIPFFWLQPGEMDIGGDSSRLYFYDPLSYFLRNTQYSIAATGMGFENINYFAFPFMVLLISLKSFLSSTLLISFFNGLSLSLSFVFVYVGIKELLEDRDGNKTVVEYSALLGALLYTLSPALLDGWQYVLLSRNQIFLNPLIFYLLLQYVKTSKFKFIAVALSLTFVFSPNFSVISAPPILAFYPFTLLFLILYTKFVLKRRIILKHIILGFILFLGIQAFHIVPQINDIFSSGSVINTTIFSDEGKYERGLSYFSATAPYIKVSTNLLGLPQMRIFGNFSWVFIIFPLTIIVAFIFNKKKILPIFAFFFLLLLFFATANITDVGFSFYKKLFDIPGFSMFRNYYGQWQFAYVFYYSVLFGLSLSVILSRFKRKYIYLIVLPFVLLLLINAIPFIEGDVLKRSLWQSKDISPLIQMDPKYEEMLSYIRSLPVEGKFLTLPLTDPAYQIIAGKNGGAYVGPSTIGYLAGKKDFSGFEEFMTFKDLVLDLIKRENFEDLKKLLGMLNIKYVFYNADPNIYDEFPSFPYGYVRGFLPKDQAGYKSLIQKMKLKEIKNIDNKFFVYEIPQNYYLPQIYVAEKKALLNQEKFDIRVPLSWDMAQNRIGVYALSNDAKGSGVAFDDAYYDLPNQGTYLDFFKNTEDSRLPWAFVSQNLDSYSYPLIISRENKALFSAAPIDDAYIERSILYGEKRIHELLSFGMQMSMVGGVKNIENFTKSWKQPTIIDAILYQKYNYWEVSLARYITIMYRVIDEINTKNNSQHSVVTNKALVQRLTKVHKGQVFDAIRGNESLSEDKKRYLSNLAVQTFDLIDRKLDMQIIPIDTIPYSLQGISEGTYNLSVGKQEIHNLNATSWQIIVDNHTIQSQQFIEEEDWLVYPNLHLGGNDIKNLELQVSQSNNLIAANEGKFIQDNVIGAESTSSTGSVVTLTFSNGLIWPIPKLNPASYYKLSFDYQTSRKDFIMNLYEVEKDTRTFNKPTVTDELLSQNWKTYEKVFNTGNYSNSGFMQITKDHSNFLIDNLTPIVPYYKIQIKNLSLVQIPHPKIVLQKNIAPNQNMNVPQITFSKINPTKYVVKVKNAQDPYMLVFSQGFDSKWELIDEDHTTSTLGGSFTRFISNVGRKFVTLFSQNSTENTVAETYYGGSLIQGKSQNSFLDQRTFDSWGKNIVASNKHFLINGYANAWYIEPKDVGNKKEYTLILEMSTQRLFYGSLAISLITFVFVLVVLLISIFKNR